MLRVSFHFFFLPLLTSILFWLSYIFFYLYSFLPPCFFPPPFLLFPFFFFILSLSLFLYLLSFCLYLILRVLFVCWFFFSFFCETDWICFSQNKDLEFMYRSVASLLKWLSLWILWKSLEKTERNWNGRLEFLIIRSYLYLLPLISKIGLFIPGSG